MAYPFWPNGLSQVSHCESFMVLLPLGPLNSLISTTVSRMGRLLRTYRRTIDPASLRASTALLWETSDTSTSFTRKIQSLTLEDRERRKSKGGWEDFLKYIVIVSKPEEARKQRVQAILKCFYLEEAIQTKETLNSPAFPGFPNGLALLVRPLWHSGSLGQEASGTRCKFVGLLHVLRRLSVTSFFF